MNLDKQQTLFHAGPDTEFDSEGITSPFRYPGGKFYALKYLQPFWEAVDHDEYREPFIGGGAVFFAKRKVKYNWLNDLNEDLMTTYSVIADPTRRYKLISLLSTEVVKKERHSEVKKIKPKTLLEVAHKTYYLNRTSFSGILHKPAWGYKKGHSVPPESWGEKIEMAGRKLEGVKLTALDFADVITAPPQGKKVFMYLDPPYVESDQVRAFENSFSTKDHERLAKLLKKTPYKFCLSYDDCDLARNMYGWAHIYGRSWWYNTANCRGTPRKMGNELIITNYNLNCV